MNLWKNYKSLLYKTFPDLKFESEWAQWEGKGTNLTARTYTCLLYTSDAADE